MKYITRAIGLGALLVFTGCEGKDGPLRQEYISPLERSAPLDSKIFSLAEKQLEGRIVKAQPSQFSYCGKNYDGSRSSANHEFVYLIVEGGDGRLHTLIYPFSKAILERDATITYRPLEAHSVDVETLIDLFLKPSYETDDNFLIEAEGIVAKEGIRYKPINLPR